MTTRRNVPMGPRNSEKNHQASPLRFFVCARPALIKLRVPHPMAYPDEPSMANPPRFNFVSVV